MYLKLFFFITRTLTSIPYLTDLTNMDLTTVSNTYTNYNPIKTCACDLQEGACDFLCCCDEDCSESIIGNYKATPFCLD